MSIADIDKFGRLLNNLYTAVFESPKQMFNRPFRNVITATDVISMIETDWDYLYGGSERLISSAPRARAYENLTIVGGYTQASGTTTGKYLTYGAGVCDETQMWMTAVIYPMFAVGACPVVKASVFEWEDDATHRLSVFYDQATDTWKAERQNGGTVVSASVAANHTYVALDNVGSRTYLAVQWTATDVSISLGLTPAWSTTAGTEIPTLAAATFSLGAGLGAGNFRMYEYNTFGLLTQTGFVNLGVGNIKASADTIWWRDRYLYTDGNLTGSGSTNFAADASFSWITGNPPIQYFYNQTTPPGDPGQHSASRVGESNAG